MPPPPAKKGTAGGGGIHVREVIVSGVSADEAKIEIVSTKQKTWLLQQTTH